LISFLSFLFCVSCRFIRRFHSEKC
jgi:hypothetical protein